MRSVLIILICDVMVLDFYDDTKQKAVEQQAGLRHAHCMAAVFVTCVKHCESVELQLNYFYQSACRIYIYYTIYSRHAADIAVSIVIKL